MESGKLERFVEAIAAQPVYYQWYKDEFPIAGAFMPGLVIDNFSEKDKGVYFCQVSATCGTVNSNLITVDMFPNDVPDPISAGGITIRPNPVGGSSEIIFENEQQAEVQIRIFNMLGACAAKLYSGTKEKGAVSVAFRPSEHKLSPGMYMVIVDVNGRKLAKAVIVNW